MLIVLEGCDGSGKTTVAKNLKNILPDAEIIHCTKETPNDYHFFYELICAGDTRNIIADRFCYGQFVYQDKNHRNLDDNELMLLEIEMISRGAKVIHVAASIEEITERLYLRKESTDLSVEEICDRYLDLFENDTLIKPHVWWTGRDY